jgi:hypothetical protein
MAVRPGNCTRSTSQRQARRYSAAGAFVRYVIQRYTKTTDGGYLGLREHDFEDPDADYPIVGVSRLVRAGAVRIFAQTGKSRDQHTGMPSPILAGGFCLTRPVRYSFRERGPQVKIRRILPCGVARDVALRFSRRLPGHSTPQPQRWDDESTGDYLPIPFCGMLREASDILSAFLLERSSAKKLVFSMDGRASDLVRHSPEDTALHQPAHLASPHSPNRIIKPTRQASSLTTSCSSAKRHPTSVSNGRFVVAIHLGALRCSAAFGFGADEVVITEWPGVREWEKSRTTV